MKLKKKLLWIIRRHPALYFIRYALLSKNRKIPVDEMEIFGDVNDISDIPQLFFDVNENIDIKPVSNFEKAQKIGIYLRQHTKVGPALSLSAEASLNGMLYGSGGVCSDFALTFNAFCLINNIPSREWNSVDKFYNSKYGHAFNEIYDNNLQKWIAIDVHKGIYFVNENKIPQSVGELFDNLRKRKEIKFIFYSKYRPTNPERLEKVYSKKTIVYLVANYRLKNIDKILNKYSNYPTFVIVIIMIIRRQNYHFILLNGNYKQKLFPFFYDALKP